MASLPDPNPKDGSLKSTPRSYEEFQQFYMPNSMPKKAVTSKPSTLRNSFASRDSEVSRPNPGGSPLPAPKGLAATGSSSKSRSHDIALGRSMPGTNLLDQDSASPYRSVSRSSISSSRPETPQPIASSSKVRLPSRIRAERPNDEETADKEARLTDNVHGKSPDPPPIASVNPSIPVDTFAQALRMVAMTRAECDFQTREQRVNPVLVANMCMVDTHGGTNYEASTQLISEITNGARWSETLKSHERSKNALIQQFEERQEALSKKVNHLRTEYLTLHRQWQADCAYLEKRERTTDAKQVEVIPIAGRATRSTRGGDVIATDHDMEQIISVLQQSEMTNPAILCKRNLAVIPDMIEISSGPIKYVYDDTNHLVTDPKTYYGLKSGLEDWTEDEKEVFNDKFAAYPKQFGIIANYLPNKTTAQCVIYYYLHKKVHIDFRKVVAERAPGGKRRRRGTDKQKGNALLADIRQHDAEVHRGDAHGNTKRVSTRASCRITDNGLSTATPTPEPESRPKRRKVMKAKSPEVEEEDINKAAKKSARKARKPKALVDSETPKRKPNNALWNNDDKSKFILLLARFGTDFKRIAASMPNKTSAQVANFYKTNEQSMSLDKVISADDPGPNSPPSGMSTPLSVAAPVPSKLRTFLTGQDDNERQMSNAQLPFAFPSEGTDKYDGGPFGPFAGTS